MDNRIAIGARIKAERLKKGLTQEELGKKLGLNKSTIQRYETGQVEKIKLPILENIALILCVDPSYLALKTDCPTEKPNVDISSSPASDKDIKFALFNGSEGITNEMYDEVKQFALMVKLREEQKRKEKK